MLALILSLELLINCLQFLVIPLKGFHSRVKTSPCLCRCWLSCVFKGLIHCMGKLDFLHWVCFLRPSSVKYSAAETPPCARDDLWPTSHWGWGFPCRPVSNPLSALEAAFSDHLLVPTVQFSSSEKQIPWWSGDVQGFIRRKHLWRIKWTRAGVS